jgi:hypothetical protein
MLLKMGYKVFLANATLEPQDLRSLEFGVCNLIRSLILISTGKRKRELVECEKLDFARNGALDVSR